jgi:hypothetical protein
MSTRAFPGGNAERPRLGEVIFVARRIHRLKEVVATEYLQLFPPPPMPAVAQ